MEEKELKPFEIEALEHVKNMKPASLRYLCKLSFMAGARLAAQRGAAWVQAYANRSDIPPLEARVRFLESLSNPEFKEDED